MKFQVNSIFFQSVLEHFGAFCILDLLLSRFKVPLSFYPVQLATPLQSAIDIPLSQKLVLFVTGDNVLRSTALDFVLHSLLELTVPCLEFIDVLHIFLYCSLQYRCMLREIRCQFRLVDFLRIFCFGSPLLIFSISVRLKMPKGVQGKTVPIKYTAQDSVTISDSRRPNFLQEFLITLCL